VLSEDNIETRHIKWLTSVSADFEYQPVNDKSIFKRRMSYWCQHARLIISFALVDRTIKPGISILLALKNGNATFAISVVSTSIGFGQILFPYSVGFYTTLCIIETFSMKNPKLNLRRHKTINLSNWLATSDRRKHSITRSIDCSWSNS